ncbi:hypothetical protein ANO11243_070130 [Dothideomycetidae sp. 11243]|nr:hypothetical protein ANO11243_070130 [fungal sp. No.11243]
MLYGSNSDGVLTQWSMSSDGTLVGNQTFGTDYTVDLFQPITIGPSGEAYISLDQLLVAYPRCSGGVDLEVVETPIIYRGDGHVAVVGNASFVQVYAISSNHTVDVYSRTTSGTWQGPSAVMEGSDLPTAGSALAAVPLPGTSDVAVFTLDTTHHLQAVVGSGETWSQQQQGIGSSVSTTAYSLTATVNANDYGRTRLFVVNSSKDLIMLTWNFYTNIVTTTVFPDQHGSMSRSGQIFTTVSNNMTYVFAIGNTNVLYVATVDDEGVTSGPTQISTAGDGYGTYEPPAFVGNTPDQLPYYFFISNQLKLVKFWFDGIDTWHNTTIVAI